MSDTDHKSDEHLLINIVTMFTQQAWVAMGKLKNPITDSTEQNLQEASFYIDIIDMMKRKMSGNLSDEEEKFLSSSLNGLKMNYLEESNKPKSEPEAQDDKSSNDSESDDSKNNSIDRNETSPEARDDKSSNDSESDDSKNNSIDRNETSQD